MKHWIFDYKSNGCVFKEGEVRCYGTASTLRQFMMDYSRHNSCIVWNAREA